MWNSNANDQLHYENRQKTTVIKSYMTQNIFSTYPFSEYRSVWNRRLDEWIFTTNLIKSSVGHIRRMNGSVGSVSHLADIYWVSMCVCSLSTINNSLCSVGWLYWKSYVIRIQNNCAYPYTDDVEQFFSLVIVFVNDWF